MPLFSMLGFEFSLSRPCRMRCVLPGGREGMGCLASLMNCTEGPTRPPPTQVTTHYKEVNIYNLKM